MSMYHCLECRETWSQCECKTTRFQSDYLEEVQKQFEQWWLYARNESTSLGVEISSAYKGGVWALESYAAGDADLTTRIAKSYRREHARFTVAYLLSLGGVNAERA